MLLLHDFPSRMGNAIHCRKDCAYLARETDALTILHKIVLSVYILKLGFGKCTKKFVFLPKF